MAVPHSYDCRMTPPLTEDSRHKSRRVLVTLESTQRVILTFMAFVVLVMLVVAAINAATWVEASISAGSGDNGDGRTPTLIPLSVAALVAFIAWYYVATIKIKDGFGQIESSIQEGDGEPDEALLVVTDRALRDLLEFNQQEARKYHANAQSQARQAFRISQGAMVFGLLVLLVGACLTMLADDPTATISVAGLTGVATAISGYIAATFLRSYGISVSQTFRYFQQPLVTSFILIADRMAKGITDETARNETHAAIATQIVRGSFDLFAGGPETGRE